MYYCCFVVLVILRCCLLGLLDFNVGEMWLFIIGISVVVWLTCVTILG